MHEKQGRIDAVCEYLNRRLSVNALQLFTDTLTKKALD